jgi:CheY-like chemotaxis protein
MNILVVDDNEDVGESAACLLSAWRHQARVAHSGPEALELAREHHPDLILLDIGLPGMDGYEVVRRLREEPCFNQTWIIALSGYLPRRERRSAAVDFDAHLVKPVDLKQLKKLLNERAALLCPDDQ